MKHNFLSFCLTALLMLFGQASLWAYDAKIDGIYYYLYGNATVTYRSSNSDNSIYSSDYSGNIVIPQLVSYRQTYKVTSIGYHAFDGCTGLTSIEIPSSVTSIGDEAFSGCTGLTSIEIPSGVPSIGRSAFSGCTGLTSIEIPSSVTSIGYQAFDGCTGLTSIEIPSGVSSIGNYAFRGTGLTSIICLANYSPECSSSTFEYVDKTACSLYVPDEAISDYKTADGWKDFFNIQGISSGIGQIESDVPSDKTYIDLTGRKVVTPRRGQLYLHDGKKVIVQ